jgi:hypothetical protein
LKQNVSQKPLAWAAGFVAVAALAVAAYMAPSQLNNNVDVAAQAGADAPAVAAAVEAPTKLPIQAAPAVRESSLNPFEGILSGDLLAPRAEPVTEPSAAITDESAPLATALVSPNDVALPSYDVGVRQNGPSQIDTTITTPKVDFAKMAEPDRQLLEAVAQVKAQKEQAAHDRWLEAMEKQQQAQQASEPAVTDRFSFGDIEASDTQVVLSTGTLDVVGIVNDFYDVYDVAVPQDIADLAGKFQGQLDNVSELNSNQLNAMGWTSQMLAKALMKKAGPEAFKLSQIIRSEAMNSTEGTSASFSMLRQDYDVVAVSIETGKGWASSNFSRAEDTEFAKVVDKINSISVSFPNEIAGVQIPKGLTPNS